MNIIVKLKYSLRLILSVLLMLFIGVGGLVVVGYTDYDHLFGVPTFFISLAVGFLLPFSILRSIKCPRCKSRFLWKYFNQIGRSSYPNPLDCDVCPDCSYDPEE